MEYDNPYYLPIEERTSYQWFCRNCGQRGAWIDPDGQYRCSHCGYKPSEDIKEDDE
ncbi:MAG TPA: hypothetical protein VFO76_00735 [Candidatus Kapabacteria bacterium]|nr:hypothetical protein [Candidatus Kapabacteria bacterium]